MARYKIIIEYDGSNYCGWQKQKQHLSVAQKIEESIYLFCQERVALEAAGRTDAGVHATGQTAHFDLEKTYHPEKIRLALNFYLKKEAIAIVGAIEVSSSFHSRFDALSREYTYLILNRKSPSPIWRQRAWHIANEMNLNKMQQAANILIGEHDFSSFRASICQAKTPVRTMNHIHITEHDMIIKIHILGKSFLHHMVRNIVGSLKLVATNRMTILDFENNFRKKDRTLMGATAPAWGLYLSQVNYPSSDI